MLRAVTKGVLAHGRSVFTPGKQVPFLPPPLQGPGLEERFLILHRLLGGHPTLTDQDLAVVAQQAKGLSRAQLNELVTKAANLGAGAPVLAPALCMRLSVRGCALMCLVARAHGCGCACARVCERAGVHALCVCACECVRGGGGCLCFRVTV